jgi:hypothetical protein
MALPEFISQSKSTRDQTATGIYEPMRRSHQGTLGFQAADRVLRRQGASSEHTPRIKAYDGAGARLSTTQRVLTRTTILQAFRVKSAEAFLFRRTESNGAVAGCKATHSDIHTYAGYNDPEKSIQCSQQDDYENYLSALVSPPCSHPVDVASGLRRLADET